MEGWGTGRGGGSGGLGVVGSRKAPPPPALLPALLLSWGRRARVDPSMTSAARKPGGLPVVRSWGLGRAPEQLSLGSCDKEMGRAWGAVEEEDSGRVESCGVGGFWAVVWSQRQCESRMVGRSHPEENMCVCPHAHVSGVRSVDSVGESPLL